MQRAQVERRMLRRVSGRLIEGADSFIGFYLATGGRGRVWVGHNCGFPPGKWWRVRWRARIARRLPMFVPSTFAVALLMTILSTICWGSFANTFKFTKNYRFELYYWDYGLGIFLIALVLAFTMGSHAGSPTAFLANLHSADDLNLGYAALGGFIFNIANVLLIAGIEIVGLSVAVEAAMTTARPLIAATPGFEGIEVRRCVETRNRYLFRVRWGTLEDHTIGFRHSDRYERWRELLHHFYEPFPLVQHFGETLFAND